MIYDPICACIGSAEHIEAKRARVEEVAAPPPPLPLEESVLADCALTRTEDASMHEVYIALPALATLTLILRIERRRHVIRERAAAVAPPPPVVPGPAAYGMERRGQLYHDRTLVRSTRKFEASSSVWLLQIIGIVGNNIQDNNSILNEIIMINSLTVINYHKARVYRDQKIKSFL